MEYHMTLGKAIQIQRVRVGMKRPALAEEAGVSYPYLSEIESDRKLPSLETLAALSDVLGCKVSDLLKEGGW